MSEPAVRLSGISKRFADLLALDDVSLDLEHGTMLAIRQLLDAELIDEVDS